MQPPPVFMRLVGKDKTSRRRKAEYRCSCGSLFVAAYFDVKYGNTQSCGCYQKRRASEASITHGGSKLPEWKIWINMRERCLNPNNSSYLKYGGRGITISPSWRKSFAVFFADMGSRPTPKHTVERRNNDGPYSRKNCYWATYSQQARNRRSSVFVSIRGRNMLLIEACEKYSVPYQRAHLRLRRGWRAERALEVCK